MVRVRAGLLALFFLASLAAATPSATACSIQYYDTLSVLSWPTADRLDTNVGNHAGRVQLETGRLVALLEHFSPVVPVR